MSMIVVLARREAELMGHEHVMPEHVVLATIWLDGSGPTGLFRDVGIAERLSDELRARMTSPEYVTDTTQLNLAMDIASSRVRDECLCMQHFLFAVSELPDSLVGRTLQHLDAAESVRDAAERYMRPSRVEITTELVVGDDGRVLRDASGEPRRNYKISIAGAP
jgi:hypothetical protein